VIASHDRRFDYRKLQVAFDALWLHKRARSLPPTRTRTSLCPEDAAAIVGVIEACAGARCEMNVGKSASPIRPCWRRSWAGSGWTWQIAS
jgi:hypothetical protein